MTGVEGWIHPFPIGQSWPEAATTQIEARGGHLLIVLQPAPAHAVAVSGDGRGIVLRPAEGTAVFLPDGHGLDVRPLGGTSRGLVLAIPEGSVEGICGVRDLGWRPALDARLPRIADAVRLLGLSADGAAPVDRLVWRLLARLAACAFGGFARRPDDSWLPAAALGRISALTEGDGLDKLSIASLAADAGLCVSAFSRGFRGSTGWTPGEYLIEARLARVASMLVTTDLPLTEITRRVGLASVAHVSQQFGSRHGMSARRFRAVSREQHASRPSGAHPPARGRKVDGQ